MINLQVQDIPKRPAEELVRVPRRLAWEKAQTEEVRQFTDLLKVKVEQLEDLHTLGCEDVRCKNQQHSEERDEHVLNVMSAWIEAGYSTIPTVPPPKVEGKGKRSLLPGWKENCEPLSRAAKFWYSVWLSAGKPVSGELHQLMVGTRVKFRSAVRKAKQEANACLSSTMLRAAEAGDRALLQEMSKVGKSKVKAQELPDSLEGAMGHNSILEKFRDLYEALYNSAGTDEEMGELKELMDKMIDCRGEAEVRKFTEAEVKRARQN